MRQTELNLSEEDRSVIEAIRSKGLHQAREVNRAHVLSSLDQGIPEAQIMALGNQMIHLATSNHVTRQSERFRRHGKVGETGSERAARQEPGMVTVSRETVRRMLKKTISSPGAG